MLSFEDEFPSPNRSAAMPMTPTLLLAEDHDRFKEFFQQFEDAQSFSEKVEIFRRFAAELKVHSKLEEEIFYPEARAAIDDEEIFDESVQEHHVCDLLVAELENMNPTDEAGEKEFEAKFKVLRENVEHHMDEEELEMFPEVDESNLDAPVLLEKMMRKKEELQHQAA